ncbi:MAG TPA: hypothetical protein P5191_00685 [Ruminococcus sp.]|nr:hypothetical protein [Ruminococcus sp.]
MGNKDNITVKISPVLTFLVWIVDSLAIIISIVATIASGKFQLGLYIFFLIVILFTSLIVLWVKRFRVTANGSEMTLRKTFGREKSFPISDIDNIVWRRTKTAAMLNENVSIKAGRIKFSIESSMIGFDKMAAFLGENIPASKIRYIDKCFGTGRI